MSDCLVEGDNGRRMIDLYRQFETCDGRVDETWIAECRSRFDASAVQALVDAHTVLVATNYVNMQQSEARWDNVTGHFSADEIEKIVRFFARAMRLEFLDELLSSAESTDCVIMPNPLGDGQVACDLSVCCGSIQFLRCTGAEEPFYLLQHNFAVEALYYPLRQCVIALRDCLQPTVKLKRFFLELRSRPERWVQHYSHPTRRWLGIYSGNGSPFHFFYFHVPGFHSAIVAGPGRIRAVHTIASQWFLPLPEVFGKDVPTVVHAREHDVSTEVLDQGGFLFSLGVRPAFWNWGARLAIMDSAILRYCRNAYDGGEPAVARNAELVLWGGVSTSKRAWIEEREALVKFVNKLASHYDTVLLLVDGWTSSVAEAAPGAICEAEQRTIDEMRPMLRHNVSVISLVGVDPVCKIAMASWVDFFVAAHATASLYVARIAGRSGVSHISNIVRKSVIDQHVHVDTTLVPAVMVEDVKSDKPAGEISYHIDPESFVEFAVAEFTRRLGSS